MENKSLRLPKGQGRVYREHGPPQALHAETSLGPLGCLEKPRKSGFNTCICSVKWEEVRGGRRDRLVPKAFIQTASQVGGSTTLLSGPGVIRGSLLHSQSPNARPLYLRSEPLRLAFLGDPPEGLLPGPQRAGSQDPRRLAPGPKEGCARCFLPGTPTFPERRAGPAAGSGGAQTMTNRTRRADAASKRDAPSLHAGQGRPGAGRLLRCERREGRGFRRRGNRAGRTHGSERAAGSGPGQGALLSPGRAHGREPRGAPVFRPAGRRGRGAGRPRSGRSPERGAQRCREASPQPPLAFLSNALATVGRQTKVLTSALVSQPRAVLQGALCHPPGTPQDSIASTLAKMLTLASFLFVMAVALCLPVCSVTAVGR